MSYHHHNHTMCNPNSSLSSSSSFTLRSINQQNTTRLVSSTTSSTSSTRPFQILGLQQVAVGSTDPAALRHLWMDIFGLKKVNTHSSEKENVIEDILLIGGSLEGGQGQGSETHSTANSIGNIPVELDLMCPMDENKSPKVHKPPLNHIGLWVDDLSMAVQWMESKGVRFAPGGIRKGAAGYDVTFIHPKGNDESPIGGCGVLIELVQAPKSVIHALKK
jgi:lactoylglutathione lyase